MRKDSVVLSIRMASQPIGPIRNIFKAGRRRRSSKNQAYIKPNLSKNQNQTSESVKSERKRGELIKTPNASKEEQ